ncbi:unnamed protein product [Rotaria socialis]
MALGPPVSTTAFVVVYNPSQYIYSITNGQNAERIEALKHLFECLTHSDIDLITLGSIWLCVTGLLTNEEQQRLMNNEIRQCAFKCILELIKIEVSLFLLQQNGRNDNVLNHVRIAFNGRRRPLVLGFVMGFTDDEDEIIMLGVEVDRFIVLRESIVGKG